MLIVTVYRL